MHKNYRITLNIFLVIGLFLIPVTGLYIWLSSSPEYANLQQRAAFLSISYESKYINTNSSEIIDGSENKGSVLVFLEVPNQFINKEFNLQIEAHANRKWDYSVESDMFYVYPTKDVRIEIVVNNAIFKVLNYTPLTSASYNHNISYGEFKLAEYGARLSYNEKFIADSSRNKIEIRLITEHKLYKNQKIFSSYFVGKEYVFTICIGNPELILYQIEIYFTLIWFLYIIIMKKYFKKSHN